MDEEIAPQLTLGDFTAKLESIRKEMCPDAEVKFGDGRVPAGFHSYRGYYDHLALDWDDEEESRSTPTLEELLQWCISADGGVYEGYKGGDWIMHAGTPVWVAHYGDASRERLVDAHAQNGKVVLLTATQGR